jgi:site-specific DNA-methyltransferase (adenine-specific)
MIQLMHGDCLELMKQIPDGSIDLVLTDPPYGIGISKNPFRGKFEKKNGIILRQQKNILMRC